MDWSLIKILLKTYWICHDGVLAISVPWFRIPRMRLWNTAWKFFFSELTFVWMCGPTWIFEQLVNAYRCVDCIVLENIVVLSCVMVICLEKIFRSTIWKLKNTNFQYTYLRREVNLQFNRQNYYMVVVLFLSWSKIL